MKILLQEIKKILRPSVVFIFLILYFSAAVIFGFFTYIPDKNTLFNGSGSWSADELETRNISVIMSDIMLEKYGLTVEGDELNDFIEYAKEYEINLDKAIARNEYCKMLGITSDKEINENWETLRNNDNSKIAAFFENTSARYFEYEGNYYLPALVAYLQMTVDEINAGIDSFGEDFVFHVYNSEVIYTLSKEMVTYYIISVTCAMIAILPYGIRDKRSNIAALQYSSKIGRKLYLYKTAAVLLSSAFLMVIGIAVALTFYQCLGIERYDDTVMDSFFLMQLESAYAQDCVYSGITIKNLRVVFSLTVFILGIILCAFVHIICEKLRNPITASVACLPIFGVMYFCIVRYLSDCVYPVTNVLLFKGEGLVALTVIVVLYAIALLIDSLRQKKKSF